MADWFVLYVTNEPKALAALHEGHFKAFYPTHLQWVRQGHRKTRQPVPLLPRYVLAQIPEERFHEALSVQHVAYVICANGKPRALDEQTISELRAQYDTDRWDEPDTTVAKPKTDRRSLKGLKALEAWLGSPATKAA